MTVKRNCKTQDSPPTPPTDNKIAIKAIITFLQMFMTETLAKRLVSMVMIAAGISNTRVSDSSGLCDRSVRELRKNMNENNLEKLFTVGYRSGRPSKTKGLEDAIIEEIGSNNYHTRQQVADMIHEKFGITLSLVAVGRLLKKTVSSA